MYTSRSTKNFKFFLVKRDKFCSKANAALVNNKGAIDIDIE
jgi:hypothetical protein